MEVIMKVTYIVDGIDPDDENPVMFPGDSFNSYDEAKANADEMVKDFIKVQIRKVETEIIYTARNPKFYKQ
jgi:hypothetical protein